MKHFILLLFITSLASCKEDKGIPSNLPPDHDAVEKISSKTENREDNQIENDLSDYVHDFKSFSNVKNGNPIEKFKNLANDSGVRKIEFNKENLSDALKTAASFNNIFITVENHTVVKIDDLKNCKQSASWSTCVPFATGYIKKGEMLYQEDYANNIIGVPDSQKRTMYFFN